ncbi:MAG: type IV pilus assembly protein PilM [Candidatus Aureabacteria bacterium]|nr:type IV pilus assembly protein PilM [Candidatus Auribacterota bacterium]
MKLRMPGWLAGGTARLPLGVDIGASSIKGVLIKHAGGEVRIVAAPVTEIPRERAERPSPELVAESLRRFFEEHHPRADRRVSAFPLCSAIVRNTTAPFAGEHKIRQVIKFQAEPLIPFAVEEVVIDFHETGTDDTGKTQLIVIGAKKDLIARHLETWAAAGVDPEIVGVDVFALVNNYLFRVGATPTEGLVALLDCGATKTGLAILQGRSVLLARSITVGGDDLTEAIQKEFGIDFTAAEAMKRENGSAIAADGAAPDAVKLHGVIAPLLTRLTREIDRSLRSLTGPSRGMPFSRVYLAGGGALLSNIRELCAREFGCETGYLSSLAPPGGSTGDEEMCRTGIAMGLALQGLGLGAAAVDLRREEYVHAGPIKKVRRHLRIAAVLGICVVGLGLYDFTSSLISRRREHKDLAGRLEAVYRDTFPDAPGVKAPAVLPTMERTLKEYQESFKSFAALSGSAVSSLDILREISARMPQALKTQVTGLSISQGKVELDGLVNNPADADAIKAGMEKSRSFKSIDVPSTSAYEGGKYKFKLVAEITARAGE